MCAHLPAHHVGPLIAKNGEVAIGVDPVFICAPDDGLRSRTDDEFFLKFRVGVDYDAATVRVVLQPVVCHDGAFLGEAFDVLRFAAKIRFRDEKGEVGDRKSVV